MTEAFPRLLVATEFSPNAPGGGPAVVRQMLRGWPAENIYWWSCLPELDQKFGQKVAGHAVASIPKKLYPHQRWGGQKSWVLENLWTPWAGRHFQKTLDRFRPEAVWVIPHSWSIPPIARVLPGAGRGFHVSIHDYADCGCFVNSFGPGTCHRLLAMADRLYAKATTCDAICQPMLADLQQRTGRTGGITRAGLESEDFAWLNGAPGGPAGGPLRIGYAGTIQVEDTFALFVRALKAIRQQLPRPATLEFFGNHSYRTRPWFEAAWMNEHGSLPAAQLTAELRKCDWGFSPMALTDEDPRYNRFSLPTKLISYLAAGLPVITLGHPESSLMKMAATHPMGICSSTTEAAVLSGLLLSGLAEPEPARKYQTGIRHCAESEFNARRMRDVLFASLRKCAFVKT